MKKLIMSLAVVAVASIATATNVKWGVSTALDTDKFADGSKVYLVQGTYAAPAEAPETWTTSNIGTSYAEGSLAGGTYQDDTGVSLTTTATGFNGNTPFYVAVISADGKNIAVTSSSNINVKNSALSTTFYKTATSFTTYPAATPVPEPTAVALLALGLAALGVKRKVA